MTHRIKSRPQQTNRESDRIITRLPDGMRDRLAALAESNGRSMTAEVVAALEKHLAQPGEMARIDEAISELAARVTAIEGYTSKRQSWLG